MSQYFSIKETPIEAALDYAARGIPVFPAHARQDEKQEKGIVYPLIIQGVKGATTNISEICMFWSGFPRALVGIPTGAKTGLLAMHVSSKSTQNWEKLAKKEEFDPDETLSVPTPWGRYYFYKYPILHDKTLGCTENILEGIDAFGEGGSVVLPPLKFWTLSKTPTKIIKIGGIKYPHSKTIINEVKILDTDYDITKEIKTFPNGLLSYLQNFSNDSTEQAPKICKTSRLGGQILFSECNEIKKIGS